MNTIRLPEEKDWNALLQRPAIDAQELQEKVHAIVTAVKENKDQALLDYAAKFDGVALKNLSVSEDEFNTAIATVSNELKQAITQAKQNIALFHSKQKEQITKVETMPGVMCWRKSVAIDKVGLYIPGGSAPLFSTILMLGIPASLAGCREIVLCTPPDQSGNIHPAILYTASLLGIKKVIKAGGAQAIAAMTFGTESVPAVYKIFGPGNQYVTAAKQLVTQYGVAIDMPAGPSEVAVIADANADAELIAADLLSQAEHGGDSQVIFITPVEALLSKVEQAIEEQLKTLPRTAIATKAIENSKLILVKDMEQAFAMSNAYAPEHLILHIEDAETWGEKVINAGSVFLGAWTPESAGDYASGTNHTLPTNGYARAYSGVSLDSFIKKITFQQISKEGLKQVGPVVEIMAESEHLHAHKNAVTLRLKKIG
ncbi:MAG TPA: histidinol dehydrogenase [Cytophagaceae bacterium]|jgi:histidinol dehydrogenase|nr:histidinol dehydrogenase [Cytophagaceae bacterium]